MDAFSDCLPGGAVLLMEYFSGIRDND